jgi:hypothetical protein
MTLRHKNQAPFRCCNCGLRFIAQNEAVAPGSTDHYVPFAGYLGLAGRPRRVFTDQVILGSLLVATLLVLALAVVALAFSWIDPALLHLNGATPPANR